MKLSIVIGTRNRPYEFGRLVCSIRNSERLPFEIVYADASDDIKPWDVEPWKEELDIRMIREVPRLGHSAGYNKAFAQARGEWVIYLNDDCEVMSGPSSGARRPGQELDASYFERAITFMESHPEIGLGALPYSNKGGRFMVNSNAFDGMIFANFGIIRRSLGDQVGWFDAECVSMYGADNSLGFRVLLAGFGIAEIPNSFGILHHESPNAERENIACRTEQGDRLRAKYLPRLAEMREVYERTKVTVSA